MVSRARLPRSLRCTLLLTRLDSPEGQSPSQASFLQPSILEKESASDYVRAGLPRPNSVVLMMLMRFEFCDQAISFVFGQVFSDQEFVARKILPENGPPIHSFTFPKSDTALVFRLDLVFGCHASRSS